MAWQQIPKEHHPLFYDALPDDPRSETVAMFGGIAGLVNGHMYSGLWADTVVVRLDEPGRAAVLAMDGGREFDPMGKGRPIKEMVLLPKELLSDRSALRTWLAQALQYTATLPPKKPEPKTAVDKRVAARPGVAKPATDKRPAKETATKKRLAKKPATKKGAAKKPAAKKRAAKKPAAKKRAAKKPAAKKRAAKKAAAKKRAARKPARAKRPSR